MKKIGKVDSVDRGQARNKVCPLIGKPCIGTQCVAWDNLNGQCVKFPQAKTLTT